MCFDYAVAAVPLTLAEAGAKRPLRVASWLKLETLTLPSPERTQKERVIFCVLSAHYLVDTPTFRFRINCRYALKVLHDDVVHAIRMIPSQRASSGP